MKESKLIKNLDVPVEPKVKKDILRRRTLNEILESQKGVPNKRRLFGECWNEQELCVCVGDAGMGKTTLALQIGLCIAKPSKYKHFEYNRENMDNHLDVTTPAQKVLFFNFEMDDYQIAKKFHGDDEMFLAPDNYDVVDFGDSIMTLSEYQEEMEKKIVKSQSKVIIIDNLSSFVAFGLKIEDNQEAVKILKWLKDLKKKLRISILLIHHPPKRNKLYAYTINDIGGSSAINRFIDSAFAIGENVKGMGESRFLKQLKSRNSKTRYKADSVILFEIKQNHNRILCSFSNELTSEQECIKFGNTPEQMEDRNKQIFESYKGGNRQSEIARQHDISPTQVNRIVDKLNSSTS